MIGKKMGLSGMGTRWGRKNAGRERTGQITNFTDITSWCGASFAHSHPQFLVCYIHFWCCHRKMQFCHLWPYVFRVNVFLWNLKPIYYNTMRISQYDQFWVCAGHKAGSFNQAWQGALYPVYIFLHLLQLKEGREMAGWLARKQRQSQK